MHLKFIFILHERRDKLFSKRDCKECWQHLLNKTSFFFFPHWIKITLLPHNVSKNNLICFWTHNSVWVIYLSLFVPILHDMDYRSFIESLMLGNAGPSLISNAKRDIYSFFLHPYISLKYVFFYMTFKSLLSSLNISCLQGIWSLYGNHDLNTIW